MDAVKPKKNLGQHFLKDQNIARKIVDSLGTNTVDVLEVGPGMGVLTRYLLERNELTVHAVEIDNESVEFIQKNYPEISERLYAENFLKFDFLSHFYGNFSIIGNFPYNISSQIFFKIFDYHNHISEVVGMVQKEVAERISSVHGSKTYGILSVLLQVFYNIEYLFTVSAHVFIPPPKVKSAVIRMTRSKRQTLPCDEKLLVYVVKTAFNQRRKMLRNSLKEFNENIPQQFAEKRPEQLSADDYILLTTAITKS
ncbi:MAG: 16S rRNA (adenine(1518)-N(6)/adenine(1519)-N(6))-dimethyltransferase RsmA [Bacteroidales bacterium]|jgi:16S rRNA (adenine1518-N6/adenine1519-N6)-dimethyltransferase|nr:16S rRNA (adenine(1518)-N(6)/adenine(1519)-N(6))-dimethyltransferase RsmA [Bacteroidales bacterium]